MIRSTACFALATSVLIHSPPAAAEDSRAVQHARKAGEIAGIAEACKDKDAEALSDQELQEARRLTISQQDANDVYRSFNMEMLRSARALTGVSANCARALISIRSK